MANAKKKNKQQNALFGTAQVMEHPVAQTVTKGGLVIDKSKIDLIINHVNIKQQA